MGRSLAGSRNRRERRFRSRNDSTEHTSVSPSHRRHASSPERQLTSLGVPQVVTLTLSSRASRGIYFPICSFPRHCVAPSEILRGAQSDDDQHVNHQKRSRGLDAAKPNRERMCPRQSLRWTTVEVLSDAKDLARSDILTRRTDEEIPRLPPQIERFNAVYDSATPHTDRCSRFRRSRSQDARCLAADRSPAELTNSRTRRSSDREARRWDRRPVGIHIGRYRR